MDSSDDDLIPISMLRKKSKPTTPSGSLPSARRKVARVVKKETPRVVDSDSDSDSMPLVQLKKKATASKKVAADSSRAATDKKKKKAVKKETGVKRKASSSSASAPKSRKTKANSSASNGKAKVKREKGANVRKLKVHSKGERLDMAIKAFRWWNAEELPEGLQWRTLEHNGVMFPPPYKPHHVSLLYNDKEIELTPTQEEIASFYAAIPKDGPQLGNPKTAKIFNKNFFTDFKKVLGKQHEIKTFEGCDFSRIAAHLEKLREEKKSMTKEEKQPEKEKREMELFTNGFAFVDGHLEKVGNFRIEPPGLFRGRGEHPKTGTLKERVMPEDVTVNVGISDRVPICNVPGHAWKQVIHRDTVSWLAYWNENVMGGIKYVFFAASSSFKGKSDLAKYEKARRLKKCIDKIRRDYTKGLKAKDMFTKQRSTAMWVIDVLALRVGNEKGEDEADTVGCCSLRVEHMSFNDENCAVTLSFLGKDSMPYNNTVELAQYGDVGKQVYTNLQKFCVKKGKNEEVFHELSVTELNKHLSSLMPGLSAKVFRTFNASFTLEKELPGPSGQELDLQGKMEVAPKVVLYNDANRKVAILCNHQRTAPKSFDTTLDKMNAQLDQLKDQLKDLKQMQTLISKGKPNSIKLKKEKPASDSKEEDALAKKAQVHLFQRTPSADQVAKKIESWKKKIKALSLRLQDKTDNKEVALGTSKLNYMDPRITVAWCKRNEVPISSVFSKTLREKFVWAMDVDPDWKF
ncbi:DNA topoisomerase 1 [Phytophthora pseudosyringae]|uniref:DNA topoisomerase 1 n=1 Tax=Phytophthora pseudosyringae TaxID=221518 RepID=A0A8T1V811_9STRA|nr:DNA topoisomerase 1 [Phytophthora pseudosyringae]